MSGDRLEPIVRDVRRRLEQRRRGRPAARLEGEARARLSREPRRGLASALRGGRQRPRPYVLAEIKRRSPAAGELGGEGAADLARTYARGGARALSVVTEPDHFGGDPRDLAEARAAGLPVLRKDFIVERYQLLESVLCGADAVLLIARILNAEALERLLGEARLLGLDALVEVNDERDARLAAAAGAGLIAVNNRDLASFEVDPERTRRLLPLLPEEAVLVSASGMGDPADLMRAHRAGADACLVGEALMRAGDPLAWLAAATGAPADGSDAGPAPAEAPAGSARTAAAGTLWVKICGVREQAALLAAQAAGADAVGFVFASSPRRVAPERAAELARMLQRSLARVGVFVDASAAEVLRIAGRVGLSHAQLHGAVDEGDVRALQAAGLTVMHALAVRDGADLAAARRSPADLVLLDGYSPGRAGGTGRRFDWWAAVDLAATRPVVVAGGLAPENVGDAVRTLRPRGVDVSSGVERAPGVKDPGRIASFVGAARGAWQAAVSREASSHREVMDRVRHYS